MSGFLDEDGRDDDALLQAHLAGDPSAFGVLFTRHRDRLWAVALRTTGHPEDAADALQEAMIAAFRRAEGFRGDAAVTTWLHRIVVNASLDRLRRRKVRAADALPDDLEDRATRGDVVAGAAPEADPETQVVAAERRRRVLAALDDLAPEQKAALVLVDMEGYPVAEAAEILEVPPGTVKSRCARGRARLAPLLGDLIADRDDTSAARPATAADGPAKGTRRAVGASHPGDPPPARTGTPGPAPGGERPSGETTRRGGEQA